MEGFDLLLIEDVAPMLGVAPSTLSEWCRRGKFPHVKLPGTRRILISRREVSAYLNGAALASGQLGDGGRIVQTIPEKDRRQPRR